MFLPLELLSWFPAPIPSTNAINHLFSHFTKYLLSTWHVSGVAGAKTDTGSTFLGSQLSWEETIEKHAVHFWLWQRRSSRCLQSLQGGVQPARGVWETSLRSEVWAKIWRTVESQLGSRYLAPREGTVHSLGPASTQAGLADITPLPPAWLQTLTSLFPAQTHQLWDPSLQEKESNQELVNETLKRDKFDPSSYSPVMWPWASYLIYMNPDFLTCKMELSAITES